MKVEKHRGLATLLLFVTAWCALGAVHAGDRPRVFVLTDIENEPDDAMSLVRFLVYSNQWEVEGLVATTSTHLKDRVAPERIRSIVAAYGKVRDNLEKHEPGFPTAETLLARVWEGPPVFGMQGVGKGHDSSGSEQLIAAVDRSDRPLWVTVWGGPNVLAQALWKVRETRGKRALREFVSRLRVYTISDQDDSGPWIRKNFPELFYIASPGVHSGGGYHYATWSGISGDNFHGRFAGADFSIVDNPWLDQHIRSKGPLGAEHPHTKFLMEGDTPSFLNLIGNGLSDPEHPDWGGWGGRYELYLPRMQKWFSEPETRPLWTDAVDEVQGIDGKWYTGNQETIWRWRSAYQNDFAARMDWTIQPPDQANHPPVVALAHADRLRAKIGERVQLSAEGSRDPDGDYLDYQWFYYPEPGSFTTATARTGNPIAIRKTSASTAEFTVPTRFLRTGTLHIILAVTDSGTPALTRYRRVIIDVSEPEGAAAPTAALTPAMPAELPAWGGKLLDAAPAWFSSPTARAVADNLLKYQSAEGGWPKNTNLSLWPPTPKDADFATDGRANTIDNGATTLPLQFLARAFQATGESRYRQAVDRGLDYLFAAQYANGGWPQFYPLREGYYSHITFNDDAMIHVLTLLQDVAQGDGVFRFASRTQRQRAADAVARGLEVILKTQIRQDGKLTAWCAQYDEKTLQPAWARAYEPPSLSGNESVAILEFLMSQEKPSPEIVAAIEAGVQWFENSAIRGWRLETFNDAQGQKDRRLVADASAPRLWARFYELGTNRPLFLDRDSVFRYSFDQIERERRAGYWYHGTWAEKLLSRDYPAWKARRR